MPNRTNCVTSWGIRYEFDLTNTPPSVDRFYRGTVCLSSEKGKKNGREYDRNVPSNLAFPLKLARRVKVASRRGLFLPFAQVSARTIAFRPFFFLSFFFSRVSWRNSVPPGDHRVIEQTNETFHSFFFLLSFLFSRSLFFSSFSSSRLSPCKPPGKETESVARVVLHRGKRYRDGEEERFVEERERISSWEFLRQWWNCYSFRNV